MTQKQNSFSKALFLVLSHAKSFKFRPALSDEPGRRRRNNQVQVHSKETSLRRQNTDSTIIYSSSQSTILIISKNSNKRLKQLIYKSSNAYNWVQVTLFIFLQPNAVANMPSLVTLFRLMPCVTMTLNFTRLRWSGSFYPFPFFSFCLRRLSFSISLVAGD